jgi:hypothetical protein
MSNTDRPDLSKVDPCVHLYQTEPVAQVQAYLIERLCGQILPAVRDLITQLTRWAGAPIPESIPPVSNAHRRLVTLFLVEPDKRPLPHPSREHDPRECPMKAHHFLFLYIRWQGLSSALTRVLAASHAIALHFGWAEAIYSRGLLRGFDGAPGLPPIPPGLPEESGRAADNLEHHIREWSEGLRERTRPCWDRPDPNLVDKCPELPVELWQVPLPASTFAEYLGQPVDRVDTYLRRYRRDFPDCYVEQDRDDRRRNQPRYLYRPAEVWPALLDQLPRWRLLPSV